MRAAIPTIDYLDCQLPLESGQGALRRTRVYMSPPCDLTVSDRNPKGLPGRSAVVGLHCAFFAALRAAAHRFFCAAAIRARPSRLITCFLGFGGPSIACATRQ